MRKLKYLFTGTGRCGTTYISNVMDSIGVPCGHETIFNAWGCGLAVEWHLRDNPELVADSSWQAGFCLHNECLSEAKIIHIVRQPKHVLESHMSYRKFSNTMGLMVYKRNAVPEMLDFDTDIEKLTYFFTRWIAMIEERAHIVHRIEDDVGGLLDKLGLQYDRESMFDNQTCNTWYHRAREVIELDDIPTTVRPLAQKWADDYGYDWDNPIPRKS